MQTLLNKIVEINVWDQMVEIRHKNLKKARTTYCGFFLWWIVLFIKICFFFFYFAEVWKQDIGDLFQIEPSTQGIQNVHLKCGANSMFVNLKTENDFTGVLYTKGVRKLFENKKNNYLEKKNQFINYFVWISEFLWSKWTLFYCIKTIRNSFSIYAVYIWSVQHKKRWKFIYERNCCTKWSRTCIKWRCCIFVTWVFPTYKIVNVLKFKKYFVCKL